MSYSKPKILAQSTVMMAQCNPNSQPSGRPCNPPKPGGRSLTIRSGDVYLIKHVAWLFKKKGD